MLLDPGQRLGIGARVDDGRQLFVARMGAAGHRAPDDALCRRPGLGQRPGARLATGDMAGDTRKRSRRKRAGTPLGEHAGTRVNGHREGLLQDELTESACRYSSRS